MIVVISSPLFVTVAHSLASRQEMNVEGHPAYMSLYDPSETVSYEQGQDVIEEHGHSSAEGRIVKVSAQDLSVDDRVIGLVFGNSRLGGGQIEKIQRDSSSGDAYITYKDHEGNSLQLIFHVITVISQVCPI